MNKKILNYILFLSFLLVGTTQAPVFAEGDYNIDNNIDYYEQGMTSIKRGNYTVAIDYLKKALANEPLNSSIWNNLAVAYTSRGTYNYNHNNYESAAIDYRNAIYYLEFYNKSANTDTINQNISIAYQNLQSVCEVQKMPTDAKNRLNKAKELRGKGELLAAIVEYSLAAKDKQYAYESYTAMGDIMSVLSNDYNAAVYYDKALAIKSDDPYLHLKFGRTLYKLGNIDPAVRELDIASENSKTKNDALVLLEEIWKEKVNRNLNDPVAHMNLGAVYQNKGHYDLAMMKYKTAQSLDPKNQMIKINMATLLQQQGNYAEALAIYNEVLKNRPHDLTINSYKATTLTKLGRNEEAIAILKNQLAANPNNSNIKEQLLDIINTLPTISALNQLSELAEKFPNDAEIIECYAYALHKDKRYNDALAEYEKVIALNNRNIDAYLNIIAIYRQTNNNAKLAETLQRAKTIFPDNEKINQMLSDYNEEFAYNMIEKAAKLYDKKDYNDAIITYKKIKNPTEEVFLGIGACYQAMERYDEAISYYKKALEKDSSNPNTHYFLGLAYLYKKDYTNSEIELKKAMQLDNVNPDIADAYKSLQFAKSEEIMNKGIKLFEENKNDDAIINFNNAIKACPENGYAYYYRGLAYDTKGKNQNAITDYKKALSLNPELIMAYYSIALSYDAMNNKVEAKKMYQKFVTDNKVNDEYTKYAKQRLSEL